MTWLFPTWLVLGCSWWGVAEPEPEPQPDVHAARFAALEAELIALQERVTELESIGCVGAERLEAELDAYVTEKELADALATPRTVITLPGETTPSEIVTLAALEEILEDFIDLDDLDEEMKDVVRDEVLADVLRDYVATDDLRAALADVLHVDDLEQRLAPYATREWADAQFADAFDRIVTPPPPKDGEPPAPSP